VEPDFFWRSPRWGCASGSLPGDEGDSESVSEDLMLPLTGQGIGCNTSQAGQKAVQNLQKACYKNCWESCQHVSQPTCTIWIGESDDCNGGPLYDCLVEGSCDTKCHGDYDCAGGMVCRNQHCCGPALCTGHCGWIDDTCGGWKYCGACGGGGGGIGGGFCGWPGDSCDFDSDCCDGLCDWWSGSCGS
jgi:hypothetical protein